MFMHPYSCSQLADERQRELLAQADQQRPRRQPRKDARTSRRTERAGRRMIRLFRRTRLAALSS